ncbi:hypothetical protein SD72_02360 [Leucobacter komagatae]|uniref:Uncharacterized protein n=1 Tax=Leucobacter komagatae TaxID=55969 RepID=A0A0D0H8Q1_9MICO|nr:hypothetical protein SD72_02360 [Leucobacter komagatae]
MPESFNRLCGHPVLGVVLGALRELTYRFQERPYTRVRYLRTACACAGCRLSANSIMAEVAKWSI